MNTPTNAYITKFSSGLILVFLAFSGLLVLIPLATPASAANASGPTITVTSNNPVLGGGTGIVVLVKVSNPTSNQYTITGFSFVTPSGWTVTACAKGGYLVSCNVGAGGSGATYTVSTFTVGTGAGIPPGSSDILNFTATAATGAKYPFTSTFSTKVQDASSIAFYDGPAFSVQVIDPTTTITIGTYNTQYVAGSSPITVTATVSCSKTLSAACTTGLESGISVVFTESGYTATASYSFTPATATSGSNGVATTKFQPSNNILESASVVATIGSCSFTGCTSNGAIVSTLPGAPSQITWKFSGAAASGNHYITTEGTTTKGSPTYDGAKLANTFVTYSLADKFGNGESFTTSTSLTSWSLTITALSGAGKFDATGLPSVITCTSTAGANWKSGSTSLAVACPTGTGPALPFNYFQSPTWGSIGQFSATITGTYAGSAFGGSGASKLLITSTFAAASPVPSVILPTGVTRTAVPAGDSATINATVIPPSTCGTGSTACPPQAGVPVELSLDTAANSTGYGSTSVPTIGFGSGISAIFHTDSFGTASGSFQLSTTAGDWATFFSNVTTIVDSGLVTNLGASTNSSAVHTVATTPSSFVIVTAYDPGFNYTPASHAAAGTTIYVNVAISDKYGNPATNTANNQIQISLTSSCGSSCPLSATTAYIPHGGSNTSASFGAIAWTVPSTVGTTLTLTASGVLAGKPASTSATVTTVSKSPIINITFPKPLNGVIYSGSTSVVFSGNASASLGYAATGPYSVNISTITYKVDSGSVQSAPITAGNKVTFSVAALISAGLHHIIFNATDTNKNSVIGLTYSVLVDPNAPTVTFVTPNNANLTNVSTVTAAVVVAEGDLNATSVSATQNGNAITASHIKVSGSNNLGVNTTYTVTISGLSAGTDVIGLSATTLSGFSASASTITVHVSLPANQLFAISGTAAGCSLGGFSGTCVSYTNQNTTAASVVVFAVWKNNAGQTMGVGTAGLTVASGATDEAFVPQPVGLSPGTYTVHIFVVTTANIPVSLETTIAVTV